MYSPNTWRKKWQNRQIFEYQSPASPPSPTSSWKKVIEESNYFRTSTPMSSMYESESTQMSETTSSTLSDMNFYSLSEMDSSSINQEEDTSNNISMFNVSDHKNDNKNKNEEREQQQQQQQQQQAEQQSEVRSNNIKSRYHGEIEVIIYKLKHLCIRQFY